MLLPHNGAVDGFGTCCFTYSSAACWAPATLDLGLLDLGQQSRLRVHLAHEVAHLRERLGVGVHDELDAVVERGQLGVGDDARDLDDHVGLDVEAGHLEVDPHQPVVGLKRRRSTSPLGGSYPARGARYRLAAHG